ncbi:MAG: hypothetical protein C5B47_05240 [Verrucomicrobia bacterium]|nr:MAG: hypothetical protein C5B47_05240 [Verrucomicrobiota bacterium]
MKHFFGKGWIQLATVAGTEGLGILLTAITGFAVIHFLPKEVYGNYAYILSAINFLVALSELGINHSFLPAIGTRVQDEIHIQGVTRVILSRRFRCWLCSCAFVLPYWGWTSWQQKWLHPISLLAFAILLMGSWLGLNEYMLRMNAAVSNHPEAVARSNFSSAIARSLCLFASLLLVTPEHALPVLALASVVGTLVSIGTYRCCGFTLPSLKQTENDLKIKRYIKSILSPLVIPSLIFVLYNNFSGMVLGWISSGKVVAEANAVSRLALVLLLIDRLTAVFISPRLARAKTAAEYRFLALRFQGMYLSAVTLITLSLVIFPAAWLLLLGSKYANLQSILWLGTLGPILMNLSGFTFTMMSCRGYTKNQLPITLLSFGVQIFLYTVWGAPDVWHVFVINICAASIFVVGQYILFTQCLRQGAVFREL